jgi:LEA14-like dessication related protein
MMRLLTVLALTTLLAGSGCALITATPPSVDVTDVRLTGIGLMEQRLAVTLCVTNPNRSELAFSRVTTALDVANSPLADGTSEMSLRLPPLSSTAVPFTVVTTIRNLGPQLIGIIRSGAISYRVYGSVALTGSLGLTIPYSRSGRLDPLASGLDLATEFMDTTPSRCAP